MDIDKTDLTIDKEKRIKKEILRLKKIYKNVSKEKLQRIMELINRASFLLIMAQDMEAEIVILEDFNITTINASQSFTKPNPLFKEYRETIKSYQSVLKQLNDLTKDEVNEEPKDPLDTFLEDND